MKQNNHLRILVQVSMLAALQIVLSRYLSINTDTVRIGFSFVPIVICGMLYGPVWTAATALVADILGGLILYGYVTPALTLSAVALAVIQALILCRENPRFFLHVVPVVLIGAFFTLIVNTSILSNLFGLDWMVTFAGRIPQAIAAGVAKLVLIPLLVKLAQSLSKHGIAATTKKVKA